MSAAIIVSGLRKTYPGGVEAVGGVDLEVAPGEVFAFLGPNGAGKTTTVEILEGYRSRSAGDVSVLGEDPASVPRAWKARVGVVLQESAPQAGLTVREMLALYARYYPAPRDVSETIELVELAPQADQRIGRLSGGQQRRMDVALALIGDPDLLFLDEPTTGFDPSARRGAWRTIAGLRALGKTIFLTTHYMDEAEALADRIAVIAGGRIVAEGTPRTLGGRDRAGSLIRFTAPRGVPLDVLPLDGARLEADGRVHLISQAPTGQLAALCAWAEGAGHELADLEVRPPTLEDIYLRLTGGELERMATESGSLPESGRHA